MAVTRLTEPLRRARFAVLRRFGAPVPVFHDESYRPPLGGLEATTGMDPRRAELALAWLVDVGALPRRDVTRPRSIPYRVVSQVHTREHIEAMHDPRRLADVFGADPSDVPVDEVLRGVRRACGGTLAAARHVVRLGGSALNLHGGFHHAGPRRAGGFCVFNDIAIAVRVLRAEGLAGRVAVLDLDAHPPDGLAECFAAESDTWIGSLSGSDWGALPGVDETVLYPRCGDAGYLSALQALLDRMPPARLVFVIAGGDVLAGDRHGGLGLTLDGVRRRDLDVLHRLGGAASVWVPAGGYSARAWRVLAGTYLALRFRSAEAIPREDDALRGRFAVIAASLAAESTRSPFEFAPEDVLADIGGPPQALFLGELSASAIEYSLSRFGILRELERRGYADFRVELDRSGGGDRMRLSGAAAGRVHLLAECVAEVLPVDGARLLYVHWLTLQDPLARFGDRREPLPGQQHPGLGLAREAGELLRTTALALGLGGVAFRPSWLHTAVAAHRMRMRFTDPRRQARFTALLAALDGVPLRAATLAVSEGRIRFRGAPYRWEADVMVSLFSRRPAAAPLGDEARAVDFELPADLRDQRSPRPQSFR